MGIKLLFVLFAVLFFANFAFSADWFVRPASQWENVTENGTSFETAFDGFQKVVWGPTGVKAGDTLYICGTFIYPVDFNYQSNQTLASGNAEKHIIIDGNCQNNPGIIIAARKMPKESFTDLHDRSFSAPTGPYSGTWFWQGDPTKSPMLLRSYYDVSSKSEVAATDGSAWIDQNARMMYVNPVGNLDDIYWNWVVAWYNRGNDFIDYKNLKFFGGSGNDGGIRLDKNNEPGTSNVSIIDSEIAFSPYTAIYAQGANTDNILIENVKIHDTTSGSYAIMGGVTHTNWTFRKVEVYSREQIHYDIFGNNDAHAIGGQNMSDLLIEDCNIHDWHGDGVIDYVGSTGTINNVTIRRNSFVNLNDDEGAHLHYGVAKHGSNNPNFGSRSNNWQIYDNIFSNIGTKNNPETLGVGYAIRGKGDGGEVPAAIYNNVFYNTAGGIYWADLGTYKDAAGNNIPYLPGGIGFTAKNNIMMNLKSGGYYFYTKRPTINNVNISINNNLYWPDTLSGNNKFKWLGTIGSNSTDSIDFNDWKADSNQDRDAILSDPQFLNASSSFTLASDFQLKQGSKAINAGVNVGLTTDYAGNPIIDAPDIGAFEYSGAAQQCTLPQVLCNSQCIIPTCSSNAECDDSNPSTIDACQSPSSCNALCTHTFQRTCFDLTSDGKIDIYDLVFVSIRLGNPAGNAADIIGNDGVNIQDLQEVAKQFGQLC